MVDGCKNLINGCRTIVKCYVLGECQYSTSHPKTLQQLQPVVTSTKPTTAANAKQVDGDHYKKYGDLQPWDVIIAWKMDYLTGTALKYIARWKDKGGIKDLEKAIHCLEKQIEAAKAAEKSNQS